MAGIPLHLSKISGLEVVDGFKMRQVKRCLVVFGVISLSRPIRLSLPGLIIYVKDLRV